MSEKVEMWVSKDALSDGVRKVRGELCGHNLFLSGNIYFDIGTDAHPTETEAVAAAESMRVKKIASLQKQIARLEKLTF